MLAYLKFHLPTLNQTDCDTVSVTLRNYIEETGFDTSNRAFLAGYCLSKLSSALLMLDNHPPGDIFANSVVQAEVCRRWLDGEFPIVSKADLPEFDA